MKQIIILVVVGINVLSYAQTDTIFAESPLDFYPLNIGDIRQYKETNYYFGWPIEYKYFLERVDKDTMISGVNYKKITGGEYGVRFDRIDSLSFIVYRKYGIDSPERLQYCLNTQDEDSCGEYKCRVKYMNILGSLRELKSFSYFTVFNTWRSTYQHKLAAKLGVIFTSRDYTDSSHKLELIYATINGTEYGSPLPVFDPPDDDDTIDEPKLDEYVLYQNYPNPFNSHTKISFHLPEAVYVKLEVYNMLGEKLKVLIDEVRNEGDNTIEFDGAKLSSGIYVYKLQTEKFSQIKKMIYMK